MSVRFDAEFGRRNPTLQRMRTGRAQRLYTHAFGGGRPRQTYGRSCAIGRPCFGIYFAKRLANARAWTESVARSIRAWTYDDSDPPRAAGPPRLLRRPRVRDRHRLRHGLVAARRILDAAMPEHDGGTAARDPGAELRNERMPHRRGSCDAARPGIARPRVARRERSGAGLPGSGSGLAGESVRVVPVPQDRGPATTVRRTDAHRSPAPVIERHWMCVGVDRGSARKRRGR